MNHICDFFLPFALNLFEPLGCRGTSQAMQVKLL